MSCYFVVQVNCYDEKKRSVYDEYVQAVKPIVESYMGEYIIRSENIISVDQKWCPDRLIVIRFPNKQYLDQCFHSSEYLDICQKRELSVESHALIIGEDKNGNM